MGRAADSPAGVTGGQVLFHLQEERPYLQQEGRMGRKLLKTKLRKLNGDRAGSTPNGTMNPPPAPAGWRRRGAGVREVRGRER